MSKSAMIIIFLIVGAVVVIGVVVGGGVGAYLYYYKVQPIKERGEQAKKELEETVPLEQAESEGRELGARTNNDGCLNEALARYQRKMYGLAKQSELTFLTTCLEGSEASPGFCDSIREAKDWESKKCADAGLQNDQDCDQIFRRVRLYCGLKYYAAEGKMFGAKTDNEGCLKEALGRNKRNAWSQMDSGQFLPACLQASAPSPGFCDSLSGTPTDQHKWALKKCAEAGMPDDFKCQALLGSAESYCKKEPRQAPGN